VLSTCANKKLLHEFFEIMDTLGWGYIYNIGSMLIQTCPEEEIILWFQGSC
jgi:hypothetical protein